MVTAFHQGLNDGGLCRGPERCDRVPLGGRSIQSVAGIGGRSGSPPGSRYCRDRHSGAIGQGRRPRPFRLSSPSATTQSRWALPPASPGPAATSRRLLSIKSARGRSPPTIFKHQCYPQHGACHACKSGQPQYRDRYHGVAGSCSSLGVQIFLVTASQGHDFDTAFASLFEQRIAALIVNSDPFFYSQRDQLTVLAARNANSARSTELRDFVTGGGLMSYGSSISMCTVRLASMSAAFSRARSPATCRSSSQPSSSSLSTSRPQRRLALTCHPRCSPAPTR